MPDFKIIINIYYNYELNDSHCRWAFLCFDLKLEEDTECLKVKKSDI